MIKGMQSVKLEDTERHLESILGIIEELMWEQIEDIVFYGFCQDWIEGKINEYLIDQCLTDNEEILMNRLQEKNYQKKLSQLERELGETFREWMQENDPLKSIGMSQKDFY